MRPAATRSKPPMQRSAVVLPQPEGPSRQQISPLASDRSRSAKVGARAVAMRDVRSARAPAADGRSPGASASAGVEVSRHHGMATLHCRHAARRARGSSRCSPPRSSPCRCSRSASTSSRPAPAPPGPTSPPPSCPTTSARRIVLCIGVGIGSVLLGVGSAWLVTHLDFPLRRSLRVGAGPAAGDAGLRHGLRLRRPAAVRRPGADCAARGDRLDARRLLVPRRAQRSAARCVMLSCVLYPYVYLLSRIAFLERGAALLEAGRALGLTPWRSFLRVSLPMARPAIAARRGAGADGDAGRLRHRLVLRRADLHHRHLPRLVLARRPHRRGAAVDGLARLRRSWCWSLERLSRGGARFAAAGPTRSAAAGHPPERLARRARGRRLRAAAARSASSCRARCLLRLALAEGDAAVRRRASSHLARNSFVLAALTALRRLRPGARCSAYARRIDPRPATRVGALASPAWATRCPAR